MTEINGGCRCGNVTFVSTAEPVFSGLCHCSNCRKSTGSAFASVVGVPSATLTVTGATTQFDDTGDSGHATHRTFCPKCGSTVTQTADVMQGITMLPLGAIENSAALNPVMQIYCDSALPWSKVAGVQEFAKMPG